MPAWIHDRADHIKAKNPSMDESTAWAISTQQSHALGKSPKGYGTSKAKREAKNKYDTPKDDTKTADPGELGKEAMNFLSAFKSTALNPMIEDQTRQIVREELAKNLQQQSQKPPTKRKTAGIDSVLGLVDGFYDEVQKITTVKTANLSGLSATPNSIKSMPKLQSSGTPVNPAVKSPSQSYQSVSGAPPVRG